MEDTSRSLLERLHAKPSSDSWNRLVELYSPLIHQWVRRFGAAPSDVDDLVQEVMSVVVQKVLSFEHSGQRGAFRRWLREIALHCVQISFRARNKVDRDRAEQLVESADPRSGLDEQWEREHDEFVARRLLEMLRPEFTESTWHAFIRQVMDGVPAAAAATEVGISVNAALIAKSRVLRRLRDEIRGLVD